MMSCVWRPIHPNPARAAQYFSSMGAVSTQILASSPSCRPSWAASVRSMARSTSW
ncbi:MAG: hypothetical protein ACI4TQ_03910 [Alloprevotella sp.]